MRCIAVVFALSWWVGGCADKVEDGARSDEAPASTSHAVATKPPSQPIDRATSVTGFAIETIEVDRAEDGRGSIVKATDPRALDVRADAWPGRALDPVLHVGQLSFRDYSHPSKQIIRFVVADVALLEAGAEVAIQYGDDASSRAVITTSLEVQ
jgi:hypothetical protein